MPARNLLFGEILKSALDRSERGLINFLDEKFHANRPDRLNLESKEITPIVTSISPVLGEYDAEPLQRSIEGLLAECRDDDSVGLKHPWVELIHQYLLRFAQPHQSDDRLWKLWQKIDQRLDYAWSLAELGQLACVKAESIYVVSVRKLSVEAQCSS